MLVDGERIKALLSTASREVLICAPFIKFHVLEILLSTLKSGISVRVVTRWRPSEVACGVSDLEIFELIKDFPNARLDILDELHAKIYIADSNCLVGSANLTGAALGWSANPNVEFTTAIDKSNPDVERLLTRLECAKPATFNLKVEIEENAQALLIDPVLDEGPLPQEKRVNAHYVWLPRCAAPNRLFDVYQNGRSSSVTEGTREDALLDLADLDVPDDLAKENFDNFLKRSLEQLPGVSYFLERIARRLTDEDAVAIVRELRPDLLDQDAHKQWAIMRDWINIFLSDRFEVAPESFVVRLKS